MQRFWLTPRKNHSHWKAKKDLIFPCLSHRKMCPLRFILVFFSAIVAGYVAWRSLRSSSETDAILEDSPPEEMSKKREEHFNFRRIVLNGFWVFLDMASGKFLWRNLKEINEDRKLSR